MESEEKIVSDRERIDLIYSGKWCHYCNCETLLIDSKDYYKSGVSYGYMYICPQCGACVGCYRYTKRSFGSVANKELRELRHRGHHYFDQIWRRRIIHRPGAYKMLSVEMGTDIDHTHFGMFDDEQCRKAIAFCMRVLAERKAYIYAYDEADFDYINEHFSPAYAVRKEEQSKGNFEGLKVMGYIKSIVAKIFVFVVLISWFGACTPNHKSDKEHESTARGAEMALPASPCENNDVEDDDVGQGEFVVSVDSLRHVTFSDTLEGYKISANFVPDTAYSEHVGHISYTLSDEHGEHCISTTYNHFYAKFNKKSPRRYFSKDAFLDSLATFEIVPFKFIDVDFDGVKEFLVVHEGYNYNYYEVFKKDRVGHFQKVDAPPFDQIVIGYSSQTTFDPEKKTITIDQNSGCATHRSAVYKLQGNGAENRFQFIEKSLIEQISGDTLEYTTWKLVGNRLQIVSQYTYP